MEIIIGLLFAGAILSGVVLFAKRFLKPVKGPLPDCCSIRGSMDAREERKR
ncbi:MAG: hypothetical protein LBD55_10675 [Treponema sp.]|jgi:hypothetical protein|nr:hypothetical protein [Treponema sp.]